MKNHSFYDNTEPKLASCAAIMMALALAMASIPATAKDGGDGGGGGISSLQNVPTPKPANLGEYVLNEAAAIQLGKALFWDMQAGGDGQQACASCHFSAGINSRTKNTLNPHGSTNSVVNADVTADMFPFKSSLVFGSAGVISATFTGLSSITDPIFPSDLSQPLIDPVYRLNGHNLRQVTGRKAPSVINAVFNFRNFWDGRAQNNFNGVNPFGATAAAGNAKVLKMDMRGVPALVSINLANSSIASQAVGPANSSVEMSFGQRRWENLGRKMLNPKLTPLGQQTVATNDSVLGHFSNGAGNGLSTKYADMVRAAFKPTWWSSSQCVDVNKAAISCTDPASYSVMESNFSLFWGIAIQMYESTLIANQTPFDNNKLTSQQTNGKRVFTNEGRCVHCHSGAELTKASVSEATGSASSDSTTGFFHIGVRPVSEDEGLVDGKFKVPHLRNVELTGPYFHNGGTATLRQVVDFYDRGGNFPSKFTDSQIRPLGLSNLQKTDLVAFLLALTDPRVKNESAPFDHPSLRINNGHNADGSDIVVKWPAVGAGGRSTEGKPLLTPFLNLDPFKQ